MPSVGHDVQLLGLLHHPMHQGISLELTHYTRTQHSGCISQLHIHNTVGVSVSYTHTTQWVYQSATHTQHSRCISQLHIHTTQWVYQSATHTYNTVGVSVSYTYIQHSRCISQLHTHYTVGVSVSHTHT